MTTDMTMRELAAYLPKAMPVGQTFREGDEVVVRLMKQPQLVQKAHIVTILRPLTNERLDELEINRDDPEELCVKVCFEGQEDSEYPVWPFQDCLYHFEWINDWAGREIVRHKSEPKSKSMSAQAQRFRRIIERDS